MGHKVTRESRQIFNHLFGNAVNFDDIVSGRATLDTTQIRTLAEYDIKRHAERAIKLVPEYNTYPSYVQSALLNGVFRGDLSGSPKTLRLINSGQWREAASEYLDNEEYKNAVANGIPGIRPRMEENRDAFLRYARELGR